jgi:transcriptional regulator with XRE-family HTH domain
MPVKRPVAPLSRRTQRPPMFTGPQCRAARGLLNWSIARLAEAAGVSWRTVQRAEASEGVPRMHIATLEKIQAALEAAGVELISRSNGGVGVRMRHAR